MRALIDTCVVVDALQSREPFCRDAQALFLLCANQRFEGCLTAKALTDLYYLTHRQTHSDAATRAILTKLCTLFTMLDATAVADYEDAVMVETAVRTGVDCLVIRNLKDYRKAPLPVYAPADFIARLDG